MSDVDFIHSTQHIGYCAQTSCSRAAAPSAALKCTPRICMCVRRLPVIVNHQAKVDKLTVFGAVHLAWLRVQRLVPGHGPGCFLQAPGPAVVAARVFKGLAAVGVRIGAARVGLDGRGEERKNKRKSLTSSASLLLVHVPHLVAVIAELEVFFVGCFLFLSLVLPSDRDWRTFAAGGQSS